RNGNVATVTTTSPHGFLLGQIFKLQGASVNGAANNGYNGTASVKAPAERSFSYDMIPVNGAVPGGTASPTGPVQFAPHADILWFAIENNIYDLYSIDATTAVNTRGFVAFGLDITATPPYIFPTLIWSENCVSHRDLRMSSDRPSRLLKNY